VTGQRDRAGPLQLDLMHGGDGDRARPDRAPAASARSRSANPPPCPAARVVLPSCDTSITITSAAVSSSRRARYAVAPWRRC
jgi:hypothetical protein